MQAPIAQMLYIDQQENTPAGFCPVCFGELYAPSMICLRCENAQQAEEEDPL